jgi:creatinine amidohydrolase
MNHNGTTHSAEPAGASIPRFDLKRLSHADVTQFVRAGVPVYLGINPLEYHGPHLSLYNDNLISQGLARGIHALIREITAESWPMLWAGDLNIGVEPVAGPGSRPNSLAEVRQMVVAACQSLQSLGARQIILMSFHGAPLHNLAIQEGVRYCLGQGIRALNPLNFFFHDVLQPESDIIARIIEPVTDLAQREFLRQELPLDFHAGFAETSLALYYAPQSVSPLYQKLPPCPVVKPLPPLDYLARLVGLARYSTLSQELHFAAAGLAWFKQSPFVAYTSRPHLANRESGARIAEFMTERFADGIIKVLLERDRPPEPILRWLQPATFGGRVSW